jgi:phosphatidylserine decarboxylase
VRNERACILGSWAVARSENLKDDAPRVGEGLKFGMAAVGAYNVGGISLNCHPALSSNSFADDGRFDGGLVRSTITLQPPAVLRAGDMVGCFRIGSTLVLAVEVPDHWNFTFACHIGEKLQMGQVLGRIDPSFAAAAAAK